MAGTFFNTLKAEPVRRQPWHTGRQCEPALFQPTASATRDTATQHRDTKPRAWNEKPHNTRAQGPKRKRDRSIPIQIWHREA